MASKDFSKTILDLLPFGIDIVDENGNILYLGPGLKKRLGEKAVGKKCWEIYKDNKRRCENCPLKNGISLNETKTLEAGGILGNKTFLIHHTGITYKGSPAALEIFQEFDNRKKAALEIFEDITELKKTEADLEKFRLAVDNASDHIIITDSQGTILYANKRAEQITGYSQKEMLGKKPSLWGRQMAPDFYKNFWRQIKEERKPFTGEIINRRKNGKKYIAEIKVSPILNEKNKEIVFFIGIERDITIRKNVQKRLKKYAKNLEYSKALDDAFLASIGENIIALDKKGRAMFCNKAFEKTFGYKAKELIGKKAYETIRAVDEKGKEIPTEKRPTILALETGKIVRENNLAFLRKDGSKISMAVTTAPIIFKGEIYGAISVSRDITKEKEIEKSKSEFVSLASHQLRTPLSSVSLASEMLLGGIAGEITKEQKKYLRSIYSGVKEMAGLIEFLLDISRIEMGTLMIKPEPINIEKFTNNLLKEFSSQIKNKKLKVKKIYEKNLPKIEADRKLLRWALENLVSNAIKYNKNQGSISIEVRKKSDGLLFKITDTGYGIPQNQQERVFSKFYRADNIPQNKIKGTGLGLYILKKAVEQLGGGINFESKENQGTSFYLTLPFKPVAHSPHRF